MDRLIGRLIDRLTFCCVLFNHWSENKTDASVSSTCRGFYSRSLSPKFLHLKQRVLTVKTLVRRSGRLGEGPGALQCQGPLTETTVGTGPAAGGGGGVVCR